ncbi:restriction endonuclease [Halocatena pleomorpha]|uniref:Restriction endonuclease n=1 Tax=Halocatena pleomorpha TaxID=1785090 RepID=A0A3P3R945_9EURY|nr:restriction endonuclease [Halocatena pleomorpha]RRJ29982.1 restriction endonuclease [Halocatena pleomorpha]
MSRHTDVQTWAEDADSLAEFIEKAESHDIPEHVQASQLLEQVWEREIPQDRVLKILRRERERLAEYQSVSFSETSRAPRYVDLNDLELVSGYEFEHILAEILRRVEGDATVTEGSGDQGVDVVWVREATTVGIQAKAYNINNPVGNSAVQEIHTGSVVRQSEFAIDIPAVVTTSRYTEGAKEAAENSNVTLYNRTDLEQWLSQAELDAEAMGELLDSV